MSGEWDKLIELAKQAAGNGNLAEAQRHLQKAESEAKSFAKTDFRVCYTYQRLADIQLLLGNKSEAITSLETAIKLRINALGPHHDSVIASKMALAKLCFEAKRYGQALELATDALKLYELGHGSDTDFVGATMFNLATVYHVQKKYDEAENAYKRALSIRTKVLGAQHPDTGAVLRNYARLMKETHREAEAEHLDSCATGVITGSWKPVSFGDSESLFTAEEHCGVCGAVLGDQAKCDKCGMKVGTTG